MKQVALFTAERQLVATTARFIAMEDSLVNFVSLPYRLVTQQNILAAKSYRLGPKSR